jgi:hypothetical protein
MIMCVKVYEYDFFKRFGGYEISNLVIVYSIPILSVIISENKLMN